MSYPAVSSGVTGTKGILHSVFSITLVLPVPQCELGAPKRPLVAIRKHHEFNVSPVQTFVGPHMCVGLSEFSGPEPDVQYNEE